MMKKLGLVLALMMVVSGAAFAEVAVIDTYSNFNLISSPLVPFDPDPLMVFDEVGLDWYSSTLIRFDGPTQSMVDFDPYDTARFGNVLLGDGYWMTCDMPYTVQIEGVPDGVPDAMGVKTDMWISLPGNQFDGVDAGGLNLIGNPFNHDVPFGSDEWSGFGDYILVTDGTTVKTIEEADLAGWLSGTFQYWDASIQSMRNAGYFYADDYYLRAGKGYWVTTMRDNLALIIPANVQ